MKYWIDPRREYSGCRAKFICPVEEKPRSGRKNDCAATVDDGSAFDVIPDGTRQNATFDIASFADQVLGCVGMGNTLHILLDVAVRHRTDSG